MMESGHHTKMNSTAQTLKIKFVEHFSPHLCSEPKGRLGVGYLEAHTVH